MRIGWHWCQETGKHGTERGREQAKEKKAIWFGGEKGGEKIVGGVLLQREDIPEEEQVFWAGESKIL